MRTWCRDWGRLTLPLLGSHQAHNVAVVLAGLDLLAEVEPGLAVTRDDVVRGFAALKWPARVEVVGQKPWLVIDGAHNVASADRAGRYAAHVLSAVAAHPGLRHDPRQGSGGPAPGALALLRHDHRHPLRRKPALGAAGGDRRGDSWRWPGARRASRPSPPQALALARELTDPDGLICVTGSLFLAAEARAIVLDLARPPSFTRVVT